MAGYVASGANRESDDSVCAEAFRNILIYYSEITSSNQPIEIVVSPRAIGDRISSRKRGLGHGKITLQRGRPGLPDVKADIKKCALQEKALFTPATFDKAWEEEAGPGGRIISVAWRGDLPPSAI